MSLLQRLVLGAYTVFMWLAQPLLRRKLRRRALNEPLYGEAIEERFGHYERRVPVAVGAPAGSMSGSAVAATDPASVTLWIHAVSLGETRAAAVLVREWRARWPSTQLVLTHGTATGREQGRSLLLPGDVQVWQPWDTPGAVHRFLREFQPTLGVLMETELWPHLIHACRRARVPLLQANARMSEASYQASRRLGLLSRPAYEALSGVIAQGADDAERLRTLGAPVLGVVGNLKFDATPDPAQIERAQLWRTRVRRPVVMLASSREGEEAAWATSVARVGAQAPEAVQWLIVPRHPQRFDEVGALLQAQGWRVQRRSAWGTEGPPTEADAADTVWLGDSLGEMSLYYSLADVALLGGSFEPLGGQNLIESLACACPVVMGAHTFNFKDVAEDALKAQAARRGADMDAAVTTSLDWVGDTQALPEARSRALAFTAAHRGAATKTVRVLTDWLDAHQRRPIA